MRGFVAFSLVSTLISVGVFLLGSLISASAPQNGFLASLGRIFLITGPLVGLMTLGAVVWHVVSYVAVRFYGTRFTTRTTVIFGPLWALAALSFWILASASVLTLLPSDLGAALTVSTAFTGLAIFGLPRALPPRIHFSARTWNALNWSTSSARPPVGEFTVLLQPYGAVAPVRDLDVRLRAYVDRSVSQPFGSNVTEARVELDEVRHVNVMPGRFSGKSLPDATAFIPIAVPLQTWHQIGLNVVFNYLRPSSMPLPVGKFIIEVEAVASNRLGTAHAQFEVEAFVLGHMLAGVPSVNLLSDVVRIRRRRVIINAVADGARRLTGRLP